jgi:hypothetical protein
MNHLPPCDHAVLPPTARQSETLRVIAAFRDATGEFPSQRYLARRLNVDLAVIQARLLGLYRRGWLTTPTPAGLRCTHQP